eukprot:9480622-Pyramimonas_sp.AAC.1
MGSVLRALGEEDRESPLVRLGAWAWALPGPPPGCPSARPLKVRPRADPVGHRELPHAGQRVEELPRRQGPTR